MSPKKQCPPHNFTTVSLKVHKHRITRMYLCERCGELQNDYIYATPKEIKAIAKKLNDAIDFFFVDDIPF